MKRFLVIALAATMGLVYANTASAAPSSAYGPGDAANGIGASRHNLGSLGTHLTTSGTSEICVFCHTPHHTNTSASPAPLWNRSTAAASGYTAYGTTIGGTTVGTIGSVSAACLSCHDGVTTLDNVVNAPGKGGVNASGAAAGWAFFDDGGLAAGGLDLGTSPSMTVNTGGGDAWNPRVVIGKDLRNDHPMSIDYNSDRASLRPTTTPIGTIDLTTGLAASATTYDANNLAQNKWAIKGYIDDGSTATIADLLRASKVECSSCHDPHFANATAASTDQGFVAGVTTTGDGLFLRRVGGNVGSGVCRTCHNK